MRLRLRVASPGGETSTFEHPGPCIRIGRQTGCELELRGNDNQGISREHARIDLSSRGAFLTDLGSINGTLLNDQAIFSSRKLRVGDRIRLGSTGATLTVIDVDVDGAPFETQTLVPWFAGIAVVVLVMFAIVITLALRSPKPDVEPAIATAPTGPAPVPVIAPAPPQTRSAVGLLPRDLPVSPSPPKQPEPPPNDDERELAVASYVVLPEWGPSVLLDQRGEGYPRARLRPEARVNSSHTLICLPGYRAHLQSDHGVQLTLWGNVPELCRVPPLLLESAAVLKATDGREFDLDFLLLRGRIHLASAKKSVPARVRIRFLRESWDITLNDSASEVCAELWGMLPPPPEQGAALPLPLRIGLFTKGHVTLRTGPDAAPIDLPERSRVSRVIEPNSPLYRNVANEIPDWWARPPDPKQLRVADVMLSLKDWDERLREPGDLVQEIFRRIEANRPHRPKDKDDDPTFRSLGAYFLGSFDDEGIPWVVRLLEDPDHAEVRRAAAHALRAWLARDSRHNTTLTPILQARIDPPQRAADVQRLLYPFPGESVTNPEKKARLIKDLTALLEDGNVALRDLAAWHLEDLSRLRGGPELPYFDAGAPLEARNKVIARWKQLLTAKSGPAG